MLKNTLKKRSVLFSSKFKIHHTPQFSLLHLLHVFFQTLVSTWNVL